MEGDNTESEVESETGDDAIASTSREEMEEEYNGEEYNGEEDNGEEYNEEEYDEEEYDEEEDNGEEYNGEEDNGEEYNGEEDNGEEYNGEEDNGEEYNGEEDNGEEYNGEEYNEEETHDVDQILDKRMSSDGKVFYWVKWADHEVNTWEPIENLNCPELIEDFERLHKERTSLEKKKYGFERGLEPLKILSSTNNTPEGELVYVVQWQNKDIHDEVPATEAVKRFPEMVLKFLEECFNIQQPGDDGDILDEDCAEFLSQRNSVEILSSALNSQGRIIFYMVCEGIDIPLPVPYYYAKEEMPLVVISYLQNELRSCHIDVNFN